MFGSVARGEDRPDSDLDIMVELAPEIGLFAFAELRRHLSDLLGREVDLVTGAGLRPFARPGAERDAVRAFSCRPKPRCTGCGISSTTSSGSAPAEGMGIRYAVQMALTIIGEAAEALVPETRRANAEAVSPVEGKYSSCLKIWSIAVSET